MKEVRRARKEKTAKASGRNGREEGRGGRGKGRRWAQLYVKFPLSFEFCFRRYSCRYDSKRDREG